MKNWRWTWGEKIASGLVSFGVDGMLVFQGIPTSFIVQFQNKYAPHMVGVHCIH
jgi:hypothetical protein